MKSDEVFESMPWFWGETKLCAHCVRCGSQIQAVFRFESTSGHVGARCCQQCGDVKQRLYPRDLIQLVSVAIGNDLPTTVSPYE